MTIFLPALWIAAGVCLFAGVHFVVTGTLMRREPVFLAFGVLCLLVAALFPLSASWYQAQTIAEAGEIKRWQLMLACFIYPVLALFIGLYTREQRLWRWQLGLSAPFALLLVINVGSRFGFLYERIELQQELVLPWGEAISSFHVTTTPAAWFYYAASAATFVWALYRCSVMRRARLDGWLPLAVYLVVQFAAVAAVVAIDNWHIRSFYTTELVAPVLVVLMGVFLSRELRARSMALEASVARLQAESERRRGAEAQLRYMAYHDVLTDLPNRRRLPDALKEAATRVRATCRSAALLLLDLDHFKTINDSLGHDVGDEVLRQVADRLRNALAPRAEPIRLGGDEFAVVVADLPPERERADTCAKRAAQALVRAIAHPFVVGDHELVLGASVGLVVLTGEAVDESALMRQADMALYWAKAAGRGAVHAYAPHMQASADERLRVERGLRSARERGELELRFEPQLDACDRVVGAEALIRWRAESGEYVPPGRFIGVAEETGLIHLLGDYVLSNACERIKSWQQSGLTAPARVSINISPWQLASAEFTEKVKRVIATSGIDPRCLTFEITEGAFMSNWDDLASKVRALAALGIQFSIDDFGTGYSSLAQLKRLPVHELKIDRAFVHGMDSGGEKLVETIIAIAHHMQLRVVAEGVETAAQRSALARMGCEVFQGYYFSRPLAECGFVDWLGRREADTVATLA